MEPVTKIYQIKVLGFQEIMAELEAVEKSFVAIKKAKQDAAKTAADTKKAQGEESQAYKDAAKAVDDQKIKLLELRAEKLRLKNELKAGQLVRQEEINQQKTSVSGNNAEANSIAAIRKERSLLNAAVIAVTPGNPVQFQGNTLQYDEAIAKLKQLSAVEQEFRRQFQQDGTLVGEYTTGIIQAFKKLGIDDLVTGQVTKANAQLTGLNQEFEVLKRELSEVKVNGQGSFEGIEKQLIDNRKAALGLEQQIGHLQTELRGTGDIGNQITTGLANGFKNMKGQLAGFLLSYVGFQAVLQGITSSFADVVRVDSLDTALKNVSGSARELQVNEDFLSRTTNLLGIEVLDSTQAFKNFYAASTQAGIGADTTRDIFFAAASAAANLKLSQEDTNGVLLAFGQIASKGKVQAEELRGQIGERIPGAFSIAARAIGVTQQELNKMLQNGTVLSNEFLPKFAKELQKTFGGDTTKNVEGLQASINRLKNEFTDMLRSNSGTFGLAISAIVGALSLLISSLPVAITLVGAYAAIWAIANASMIGAKIALAASNAEILLGIAIDTIATSVKKAYAVGINLVSVSMGRAAAATTLLRAATILLTGPIGITIGIISLLVISIAAFGNAASKATNSLTDLIRAKQALKTVGDAAAETIAKEQGELDKLYKVAISATSSIVSIKDAKQKLIDQYPEYFKGLNAENITNVQLKEGYDALTKSIRERAFAQAAAKVAAEAQAKVNEVAAIEIRLDNEIINGTLKKGVFGGRIREIQDLTEEQQKLLVQASNGAVKIADGTAIFFEKDTRRVQRALLDIRVEREKATAAFDKIDANYNKKINTNINVKGRTIIDIQDELKKANEDFEKAINGSPEKAALITKIVTLKKELKEASLPDEKTPVSRTSRLTVQTREDFTLIESNLKKELAIQETKVIELKKSNKYTYEEEIKNANDTQTINVKFIDQKIQKLQRIKNLNAAEKATLETFRKERADIELKTLNDIQEIHNKQFSDQQTNLKNELDQNIAAIKERNNEVQQDVNAAPSAKAQSQLDADNQQLKLIEDYNKKVDILEKQLNINSAKNSKDLLNQQVQLKKDILNDAKDVSVSALADIDKTLEEVTTLIKLRYDKMRADILSSNASPSKKKNSLSILGNAEDIEVQSAGLVAASQAKTAAEKLFATGKITSAEFEKIYDAANLAQQKLNDTIEKTKKQYTDLKSLISGKLASLFSFDVNTDEGKAKAQLLSETLSSAYATAQSAMDNYYSAEAAQIERSRSNNEKVLQIALDQAKGKAQSQAEQASLDKQFQSQKNANDREAFEKNKKIQREQAKINLAIQLSNLAVIAFAPTPPNVASLGIAGTIMYAIQAALALANYALNVGRINSAQFAFGGEVPTRGGKFGGRPHSQGGTKFKFKEEEFEAEADEIAIIRTRNAPARHKIFQIAGTHQQIASQLNVLGGGINFQPGAKLKRFDYGGNLGQSLQAPIFVPSSNRNTITSPDNSELLAEVRNLRADQQKSADEIRNWKDRFQVVQQTSTVTSAQKKAVIQKQIGTL